MVGGGDGAVKLWSLHSKHAQTLSPFSDASSDLKYMQTLSASDDGILTMTHIESLLYTGCISGTVNLWDLDTLQLIRSVKAHQTDVLSLSGVGGFAFSGSASGFLKKWDLSYRGLEVVLIIDVVSNVRINGKLIRELC